MENNGSAGINKKMADDRYGDLKSQEKILTIGLIVEDVFSDYFKDIIHGVAHTLYERNARLVVVAGRQDDGKEPDDKQHLYKIVYNSIFKAEEKCGFDGIIVALPNLKDKKYEGYEGIPKVFIGYYSDIETTVNYDDRVGMKQAMDYLIDKKGVTEVCMLGGREDNPLADNRKKVFIECLQQRGLHYNEDKYEKTDMTIRSEAAAERLLDRNRDVQAICCVNDSVAEGLYEVMKSRQLVPGQDILVFGFDNTQTATDLIPPLSSIGSDSTGIGQYAVQQLLKKLEGRNMKSVELPTCLYGRESMAYEVNSYSVSDMLGADHDFINRLFDDCFYRYRNEVKDSKGVDLRILFFELMSKILVFNKIKLTVSKESDNIDELKGIIEEFFDNGAMQYTDVSRFVSCMDHIQKTANECSRSVSANERRTAVFSYIRNRALLASARHSNIRHNKHMEERLNLQEYMAQTVPFKESDFGNMDDVINAFNKLELRNAALYLYDIPVAYKARKDFSFPEKLRLRCVTREGGNIIIPEEKQICDISEIFDREELPYVRNGWVSFPVFIGRHVFGILVSELNRDTLSRGEYVANILSRVIALRM